MSLKKTTNNNKQHEHRKSYYNYNQYLESSHEPRGFVFSDNPDEYETEQLLYSRFLQKRRIRHIASKMRYNRI